MNLNFKALLLSLALTASANAATKTLTIYSVYPGSRLDVIFKPFTERTGIDVNIVDGKSKKLIEQIKNEGENTVADLHLDKDLVYHSLATQEGIYQPFKSKVVEENVPANFIETNKNWFTMFYRSRVIMYNRDLVSPSELSSYADLGNKKWKGKLCVRTSTSSYNQALAASIVAHEGSKKALTIFKSWVNNFAKEPTSSDRDVIRALATGDCHVGLVNSYYLAPFIEEDSSYPVRPFFANQGFSNAHVNGVGIGIVKYSKNVKEATMLLEYLSSKEVQGLVANAFDQYPVNKEASLNTTLADFGSFKVDNINVGTVGNFIETAKELMIEAEYK